MPSDRGSIPLASTKIERSIDTIDRSYERSCFFLLFSFHKNYKINKKKNIINEINIELILKDFICLVKNKKHIKNKRSEWVKCQLKF